MSTEIHEPVKAGVIFEHGSAKPAWFMWNGRRHEVREVTQRWQTKEGAATILHLGVSDGTSVFELTFNQHTLAWQLASVETTGCK